MNLFCAPQIARSVALFRTSSAQKWHPRRTTPALMDRRRQTVSGGRRVSYYGNAIVPLFENPSSAHPRFSGDRQEQCLESGSIL